MVKQLLSRLGSALKSGSASSQRQDAPEVDISRVIPDYKQAQASPEAETPEPTILLEEAVTAEATHEDKDNASMEAVTSRDLDQQFLGDQAEAAVAMLSGQYDEWLKTDLSRLAEGWVYAQNTPDDPDRFEALRRAAHDLKGMATTYGHPAISRLAGSLSTLLVHGPDAPNAPLVNLHVEACRAAYIEGRSTKSADTIATSVCAALEAQVERVLAS